MTTPTQIPVRREDCPDPDGHAALYAQREQTWRLSTVERAAETDHGRACGWCGGVR